MPHDFDDSFRYEPIRMPPPEDEEPPREWWRNPWLPITLALALLLTTLFIINRPPPPPPVVLDVPALMGKTATEVTALLGQPADDAAGAPENDGARAKTTYRYQSPLACAVHFDDAGRVVQVDCPLPTRYGAGNYREWLPVYGFTRPRQPDMGLGSPFQFEICSWGNLRGCDVTLVSINNVSDPVLQVVPAGMPATAPN